MKLGQKTGKEPEESVLATARQATAAMRGGRVDQWGDGAQENPLLSQLRVIPATRIRSSDFQYRETRDEAEFARLRNQIRKRGMRHIFWVCHDQQDPTFYKLTQGGHLRIEIAVELGLD